MRDLFYIKISAAEIKSGQTYDVLNTEPSYFSLRTQHTEDLVIL